MIGQKNMKYKRQKFWRFDLVDYYELVMGSLILIFLVLLFAPTFADAKHALEGPYVKEKYVYSEGREHAYGFYLCAGSEPLYYAKVVIVSDTEAVIINSNKIINKNMCRSFEEIITANNTDSIRAILVEPIHG